MIENIELEQNEDEQIVFIDEKSGNLKRQALFSLIMEKI